MNFTRRNSSPIRKTSHEQSFVNRTLSFLPYAVSEDTAIMNLFSTASFQEADYSKTQAVPVKKFQCSRNAPMATTELTLLSQMSPSCSGTSDITNLTADDSSTTPTINLHQLSNRNLLQFGTATSPYRPPCLDPSDFELKEKLQVDPSDTILPTEYQQDFSANPPQKLYLESTSKQKTCQKTQGQKSSKCRGRRKRSPQKECSEIPSPFIVAEESQQQSSFSKRSKNSSNSAESEGKKSSKMGRKKTNGRRRSPNSILRCDICNELYSRKDNLRAHQRVHSGEKPFKCSYCGIYFRWMGAWRSHESLHKRRHHNLMDDQGAVQTTNDASVRGDNLDKQNVCVNAEDSAESDVMEETEKQEDSDECMSESVEQTCHVDVKEEVQASNSTEEAESTSEKTDGLKSCYSMSSVDTNPGAASPAPQQEFDSLKSDFENLVQVVTDEDLFSEFHCSGSLERVWPQILDNDFSIYNEIKTL